MKLFLRSAILLLLISTIGSAGFAQNKKIIINGKITSFEESFPLEGASITVKDGKNNTGTQSDGTFSLEVSAEDKILVVTLEGYEKKEIKLTGAREYDIVLKRAGTVFLISNVNDYFPDRIVKHLNHRNEITIGTNNDGPAIGNNP
jgi:hypothetical protein